MYPKNNDNFPRTAGGYSLETYEPAVIHPQYKKQAEDLIKMAFTDRKPITTIKRVVTRVPQYNIRPSPVLQNVQYTKVQKVPIMFARTNTTPIHFINQNTLCTSQCCKLRIYINYLHDFGFTRFSSLSS